MFRHHFTRVALCGACVLVWPSAGAGQTSLSFDEVIAMARRQNTAILTARARIDEAHGRLKGAEVLLRENPEVSGAAGARTGNGDFLQAQVGVSQFFETGGQRSARIAAARAEVEQAEALAADVTRRELGRVAADYARALHADAAVTLAQRSEGIAADIARIAKRRMQAGEASESEVNLAQAAAVRERAEWLRRQARRERLHGVLRRRLSSDSAGVLPLAGTLGDIRSYELVALERTGAERPDLRALVAEARAAEAESRLGRAGAWPDVGVAARYERDERSDIGLAGLTLRLPLFDHGQGLQAEAQARASRLRTVAEARRAQIANEIRTAFTVLGLHEQAVRELETEQLPRLDDNERSAQRAFEVGEMSVVELLATRRAILDMRDDHIDQLLAAKLAEIDLEVSAGLLR